MKKTPTIKELLPVLEELRSQVAALSARIEMLEGGATPQAAAVTATPVAAPPPPKPEAPGKPAVEEGISEETILAISAAVAAFLGVRARIRQIRLITSPAWAQQGRVSIQASHRLF